MSRPSRAEDPVSDSESSDSREDEEGWNDVEEDEETQEVISLLDDRVFPDVVAMLTHCKEAHNFDFLALRQKLRLDFHGCVKLVNYIRQRAHEGLPVSEQNITKELIEDDQYLKPVLEDDAVIIGLFDLPELEPEQAPASGAESSAVDDLMKRNADLQEEISRITAQFESYRATVSETLDQRWGDAAEAEAAASKDKALTVAAGKKKPEDASKYYWESYATNDIHETMLKDTVRTESYRDFIYNNKHIFAGKTVLDIGCGTGILSMFAAKAGAARVLAVDASDIIDKARENVIHAGLSSTITLIKGRIEEVTLPVQTVDIIVSEWMGYCLLYEAMMNSVLWARDRYLAPDGLLAPGSCNMWIAPVADSEWIQDNYNFWRDVYGFDMRAMQSGIWDDVRVLHWPSSALCGKPAGFKMLDLYTLAEKDLSFTSKFRLEITEDIDALDGFLIWFDNFFAPSRKDNETVNADSVADDWAKAPASEKERVAFTTGPFGTETHWKQGLLVCKPKKDEPTAYKKGDVLEGEVTFAPPADMPRGLTISTTWKLAGSEQKQHSQSWDMR